jgi:hypothetical protein
MRRTNGAIFANFYIFSILQHRESFDGTLLNAVVDSVEKALHKEFPETHFYLESYSYGWALCDEEQRKKADLTILHDVRSFLNEACCDSCRNLAAMSGLLSSIDTEIKLASPRFTHDKQRRNLITRCHEFTAEDIKKVLDTLSWESLSDEENKIAQCTILKVLEKEEQSTTGSILRKEENA